MKNKARALLLLLIGVGLTAACAHVETTGITPDAVVKEFYDSSGVSQQYILQNKGGTWIFNSSNGYPIKFLPVNAKSWEVITFEYNGENKLTKINYGTWPDSGIPIYMQFNYVDADEFVDSVDIGFTNLIETITFDQNDASGYLEYIHTPSLSNLVFSIKEASRLKSFSVSPGKPEIIEVLSPIPGILFRIFSISSTRKSCVYFLPIRFKMLSEACWTGRSKYLHTFSF